MPAEEVHTNEFRLSGNTSLFATIDSCVAVALIGAKKRGLAHVHYDGTREHNFCEPADRLLTAMHNEIEEVRFAAVAYLPQMSFQYGENKLSTCVHEWLKKKSIPLAYEDTIGTFKGIHIAEKQLVIHPDSLYTLYIIRKGSDKRIANSTDFGEKNFEYLATIPNP